MVDNFLFTREEVTIPGVCDDDGPFRDQIAFIDVILKYSVRNS